jgi:hypothetical protein
VKRLLDENLAGYRAAGLPVESQKVAIRDAARHARGTLGNGQPSDKQIEAYISDNF